MRLFVQQGYGKGNKIEEALHRNTVDGVILSPRDDRECNIIALKRSLERDHTSAEVFFDPQFYYTLYTNATSKNLNDISYFPGKLTLASFRSTKDLNNIARNVIGYQQGLNVDYLLSPTIMINSFTDRNTQIVLNLTQECINVMDEDETKLPLIVSLIFEESALNETTHVNSFLNEISVLPVDGFYITVARSSSDYNQEFISDLALSNLLTFIYSLSVINEYKVIMGYSDIIGLLYLAAGAYGIANGWHNSSRKFTVQQRILPQKGGRAPRDRYFSIPLFNSILLSELDSIFQNTPATIFNSILSGTSEDIIIKNGSNPSAGWTRALGHQQHWAATKKAIGDILVAPTDITARFDNLQRLITEAEVLHDVLRTYAVQLERYSKGSHLEKWKLAINQFRAKTNI